MSRHSNPGCNCHTTRGAAFQTLDELSFERGIWYAAQHGDYDRVEALLIKDPDVDKTDISGYTALHYAARNGHTNVCMLLVQYGADIDAITRPGQATSLHRACTAGKLDVVRLLLANNASVHLKDCDGKTALHRAAEMQHKEICQCILSTFPSLKNEMDSKGKLAIDYIKDPELSLIFEEYQ